jgi:hypothetical protein
MVYRHPEVADPPKWQEGKDDHVSINDDDLSSVSSVLSSDVENSDIELDDDNDSEKSTKQAPTGAIEKKRKSPRASSSSASSRKSTRKKKTKTLAQSQPDDVMSLLQQLLEQQSQLISMMHEKCANDNVTTDGVTGVSALTAAKPFRNEVGSTSCNGRYPEILPRGMGEHDMALFARHSYDMQKLIEENAELRKEKLIRDMLNATSKH